MKKRLDIYFCLVDYTISKPKLCKIINMNKNKNQRLEGDYPKKKKL